MSDRISLLNQIWQNKRTDGGAEGSGGTRERNGGPREQLRFVRALACGRAAKKSVRAKEGAPGMHEGEEKGRKDEPSLPRAAKSRR